MKTEIGKQYCVTCDSACDIVDTATNQTIHTHHEGEAQSYFTAIGLEVEASDDTAVVTEVFKSAPAGNGGGGYIESNLNVGHGAADAVKAVCTLTLGDLATGGKLEDSNGQYVELEDPHKYATGTVAIPDATAAGTLAIGEWSKTWEAKAAANATGYWPNEAGSWGVPPIQLRKLTDPEDPAGDYEVLWEASSAFSSAEDFVSAFNSEQGYAEAEISELEQTPFLITAKSDYAGKKGNSLVLCNPDGEFYFTQLQGGQDARTAVDVFNDIRNDENCPVDVTLDTDEMGLGFTATEYGVNDEIAITGSLFSDAVGMSGGHGDYTVAEVIAEINGDDGEGEPTYPMGAKAEATETEGVITLTANEAGAEANSIVYTATGCFGSGTVKQGSTTRGKNAVAQTDYEIILNGNQPRPLTTTTAMKNGGVYTVAAAYEAATLSLPANATAEIWVRIGATAFNVHLPDSWVWVNGAASDMTGKTNTTFCIAVRNDGVKVLASMQYSYTTTPAQS